MFEKHGRKAMPKHMWSDVVDSGEPSCAFYTATFERLFRVLVHPEARVRERQCESMGAPACVFEVAW